MEDKDDIFNMVKSVATNDKYNNDPMLFKEQITKLMRSNKIRQKYEVLCDTYLYEALFDEKDKQDARNVFYNIILDVFEKTQDRTYINSIGFYALIFEELEDILAFDYTPPRDRRTRRKQRGRQPITEGLYWYARFDNPLLIIGETGTGKEYIAKVIHKLSKRINFKLERINCAAIPKELFESTIFGHKKGAFTGANYDRKGMLAEADKGTLFLDEIGKMPMELQAKLLRVIEEKEFRMLGDNKPVKVDVRLIAAAQPGDMREGKIYPDLLYRLGYPRAIEMPTLRERIRIDPETVIDSAMVRARKAFKNGNQFENEIAKMGIDRGAEKALHSSGYNYPGNYRELVNILQEAIISAVSKKREKISVSDLTLFNKVRMEGMRTGNTKVMESKSIQDVKLKDIIDYADSIKTDIVKNKIIDVYSKGKDIKRTLQDEKLPLDKYNAYLKKLKRVTGVEFLKELRPGKHRN